ncbi:MAG: DUF1579 domain-containing protein [Gemmataceae bacterium]
MTTMRTLIASALIAVILSPVARAQPTPKPGPEHDIFKKQVGTWETTMKMGTVEEKGTATYKMDLGGLWLVSTFESNFGGSPFSGRGFDSYDAGKKKYVSVWMDSMSTAPIVMEGTYDTAKKTLTMVGDAPGPDGKAVKHKAVSEMPDDDTINFSMYMGDAKQPTFTILYKRKK